MSNPLSIIIPLHNEQNNVDPLINGIRDVLDREKIHFELILVDDGSSDATYEQIRHHAEADQRVQGIRFRRNYGQTAAIRAGIDRAGGDICITMDGDLQHDPAYIPDLLKEIQNGMDLVCTYRALRNDGLIRRIPSKVANKMARLFSGLELRDFGSTYRAYRTGLAKEMLVYGEMHRFIPVFFSMQTSRITEIPITLQQRIHGRSNYGIGRTLRVFSDLFVLLFFAGFFNRPIHIFGYISLVLGAPGLGILSWLTFNKLFYNIAIMDYSPLFTLGVLLLLVSVQLFTTGIVCEYLVRIYYNNDRRKPYSVAETTFQAENKDDRQ